MARKKRGTKVAVRATARKASSSKPSGRARVSARSESPKNRRPKPKVRAKKTKRATVPKRTTARRSATKRSATKRVATKRPATKRGAAKKRLATKRLTPKRPVKKATKRSTKRSVKPAVQRRPSKKVAQRPAKTSRKPVAKKRGIKKTPKRATKKSKKPKKLRRPPRLVTPLPLKNPHRHPWRGRTAEGLPKRRAPKVVRTIHSAGEVLVSKLLAYREKISKAGEIRPPEGHEFGEQWASFSPRAGGRAGIHRNVAIGMILRSDTIETIALMLDDAAREVVAALPRGFVNASLFLLEYGRTIAASPGELYFDDGDAFFVQSFGGVPRGTLSEFYVRIRRELTRLVTTDRSAVFVEHATVRAYREKMGTTGPRRPARRR